MGCISDARVRQFIVTVTFVGVDEGAGDGACVLLVKEGQCRIVFVCMHVLLAAPFRWWHVLEVVAGRFVGRSCCGNLQQSFYLGCGIARFGTACEPLHVWAQVCPV